jgi:hypothetical protein
MIKSQYLCPLIVLVFAGTTCDHTFAQNVLEIPEEMLVAMQKTGRTIPVRFIQYEEKVSPAQLAATGMAMTKARCEQIQNRPFAFQGDLSKLGQTHSYFITGIDGQVSVTVSAGAKAIGKGDSCQWQASQRVTWQHWDQSPFKRGATVTSYDLNTRSSAARREITEDQYTKLLQAPGARETVSAVKPYFVPAGERQIIGLTCKVYRLQANSQPTVLGTEICITSGDPNQGGDLGLLLYQRIHPDGLSSPTLERIAVRAYPTVLMDAGVLGRPSGVFESRQKTRTLLPPNVQKNTNDDDEDMPAAPPLKPRGSK